MADTGKKNDLLSSSMSLGDHLEELRLRIILALLGLAIAMVVCMFFGKLIIAFIERPYVAALGPDARLQSLAPADGFISYMNIAMVGGVVLASPWIFYQLWMFISAGLYPHEKRWVYVVVPFSVILFIAGVLLFVLFIAPVTLKFLVLFNRELLGVESNFTFKNYILFVTGMMLAFGAGFQTPIVIFFLNKFGLLPLQAIHKSRKFVILGIVVLAAAITPGSDMFSLFSLAIPLYLLFEFGVLLCYFSERKRQRNKETNRELND
jgi:sec-independent protein translocase protein TatC